MYVSNLAGEDHAENSSVNYFPETSYPPISAGSGISPFENYGANMRTINQHIYGHLTEKDD